MSNTRQEQRSKAFKAYRAITDEAFKAYEAIDEPAYKDYQVKVVKIEAQSIFVVDDKTYTIDEIREALKLIEEKVKDE